MAQSKNLGFKQRVAAIMASIGRFFASKPMRIIRKFFGFIMKSLATILLIGIITGCIAGCIMTIYVFKTFSASPEVPDISKIMDNGTSIIYTKNAGGEWEESQRLEGINRIWTDLPDIPDYLQKAIIAIEDERFYLHQGVDWKRTAGAVLGQVLGNGTYGGSTITQQLIKVISGDNDTTIERKIREIFRALEMERDYYTKDEILEAYLNILPLSDDVVGVGAAANYYFAKDVEDLTLAESALIAGVTNLPAYYDPYDHPDHAKKRQETILFKMHELGFITDDEYRQAYSEELHYNSSVRRIQVQDYYVDTLIEDVIRDLMLEYGYNYNYAEQLVYFGGLRIYSYEDVSKQRAVEAVMQNPANFIDHDGEEERANAAVFIMDYEGRVVAVVGSRDEKTGNRVQNHATQSQRQPGSTMKPIAVYGPAIEQDLINYSTIVRDAPITLADGKRWPPNYGYTTAFDSGTSMTVQSALAQSKNTIPAQILEKLGIDTSYNFLVEKLRFTSLVEQDRNYAPLALGGLTYGVTVREMAAAYQIFGNQGIFNSPHTYNKVETEGGEVLLEHVLENDRVISLETATIMNKLLQTVTSSGTAANIAGDWRNIQMFSKTGTTNANKDAYFCAGTPYYVGALWMGYESNRFSLSNSQTRNSKEVLSECMKALHTGLPATTFEEWGEVVGRYYNPSTGVATSQSEGSKYGYYKADNIPYGENHFGDISYSKPTTTTTTEATTTTTKKTKKTTTTTKPKKTTTTTEKSAKTTTTELVETTTTVTTPTDETIITTFGEGETTTTETTPTDESTTTTLGEGETTTLPSDVTSPDVTTTTAAEMSVEQVDQTE